MNKLIQIELNEFNFELLESYANKFNLGNISYFLSLKKTEIYTRETIEHKELDPWVQWVSVHTGTPHSKHKISHLGEGPKSLIADQTWDVLARAGVTSGVWGAMNTRFRDHQNIKFFLPDPWCFDDNAKPHNLNYLASLSSYYAKNYSRCKFSKVLFHGIKTFSYVVRGGGLKYVVKDIGLILSGLVYLRKFNIVLFSWYDLISVRLFIRISKRTNVRYSVVFINCIAHLQHHEWIRDPASNINYYVMRVLDKILGALRSHSESMPVLLTNGFSQKQENSDYFCYRVLNPERFLNQITRDVVSVMPGMTNDVLVTFGSDESCDIFINKIKELLIQARPIFFAARCEYLPKTVSYRLILKDFVPVGAEFLWNGDSIQFYKWFGVIANRTGSHVPTGTILSKDIDIPLQMVNHELHHNVIRHFH